MKKLYLIILLIPFILLSCKKDKVQVSNFQIDSENIVCDVNYVVITVNYSYKAKLKGAVGYYSPNSNMSGAKSVDAEIKEKSFVVRFSDLSLNTTYYYYYEYNNGVDVIKTDVRSFTTVDKPTVTTVAVTNVTASSVTCKGNVTDDGGAAIKARGFCYSTDHNPTINGPHTSNGTETGEFTGNITGLDGNTTYYVRAYVTNVAGTTYGSELSFVTLQQYTVSVSANPDYAGTVTGGGNYINGHSCTVSATANEDYAFDNWTENGNVVSTDANYTFNVTSNRTLTANFSQIPVPTGAIRGKFSVSPSRQVYFSKGNLKYKASSNTWSFADNQYDYVGSDNSNISSTYSGWIDLFGWGTSGYNHGAANYQPWSTSTNTNYYVYGIMNANLNSMTGQADWGYNAISNGGNQENYGWRTLTEEEWVYMFYTRVTVSGIRYAKAMVNGKNGIIILPDNWNTSYYSLNNANSAEAEYSGNMISAAQWNGMEQHGAIFLPAAGYRNGTVVNAVGSEGYYWSATHYEYNNDSAYCLYFNNTYQNSYIMRSRYSGISVRLVCDVE